MAEILVIDDDNQIRLFFSMLAEKLGHNTVSAKSIEEAQILLNATAFDLIFLDIELPDGNGLSVMPEFLKLPFSPEVIIITGTGNVEGAELAFKYGAWDFVQKPLNSQQVILSIARALQYHNEKVESKKTVVLKRDRLVGESPEFESILDTIAHTAMSESNVLITGETGTGKELIARTIHENSNRKDNNFVVVDCASLPPTLIESILFGHEKGAFTGATTGQSGLIKQAEKGTLFIDEIGELPLSTQKVFLRVLQERCFRSVGSVHETSCDFRMIAATHRDLNAMVSSGDFRQDLLYRICSISIELPPLRERLSDILSLTMHRMKEKLSDPSQHTMKACSPELFDVFMEYKWPGNIRELFNVLDHAVSMSGETPTLYPIHLPPNIRLSNLGCDAKDTPPIKSANVQSAYSNKELPVIKEAREKIVAEFEKEYLIELMQRTSGSIKNACTISGLSKSRLLALLNKYNTPRFRKT